VAARFQTEHREIHLGENQLLNLLPDALAAMDQPTMDAVNTFVVSKAVKEAGVTVALSGLGGDELFAGYPSFYRAVRLQKMSNFSRRLLRSASGIGRAALGGSVQRNKFWELVESNGAADVYNITRQLFPPDQVMNLLNGRSAIGENTEANPNFESRSPKLQSKRDPLNGDSVNAISRLEMKGYMANTLLRDTDSMSMAHSLEVRVPFVDIEVACLVLSLPGSWKLNGSRPKPLLADALSDLLSQELLQRPKMGFTLPFEKWMQSRLRDDISSVLEDKERSGKAGLEPGAGAKIWQSFLKAPRAVGWSRPWALYVLGRWCEINGIANCEETELATDKRG
jgi:asparagine synthase (glutamine-hydrolysing)